MFYVWLKFLTKVLRVTHVIFLLFIIQIYTLKMRLRVVSFAIIYFIERHQDFEFRFEVNERN